MRKRIACAVLLGLVVALNGCATGSSNPPSMYPTPAIEQAFNTIYDPAARRLADRVRHAS
jgi:hypothetical protein